MAIRNTTDSFGWLSRSLHWAMALAVLAMLVLGTVIAGMEVGLANLWLFGLHKTIGITLLALVLVRLIWHRISPPPAPIASGPIGGVPDWQQRLALWTHGLFYALLLAIPLSGWIASSATGLDVVFADRWVLPALAPVSEAWEKTGFAAHGILTKGLIGLIVLHVAGALKRAHAGDGTLRRMLRGTRAG